MDRVVQVFLEGNRVELFKDEQITINSTIQNIADLSKTFTDFTQSFQIPASATNNQLFQHFYNSDVAFHNGTYINPSLRRNAFLEIDNTFFRRGKLSLEKANMENGKPYSYTVTFYGDLVSLKDKFGEKMFIDLDWSGLNFAYTYSEIKARVEDGTTDYDVRYPLISGERYWQYDNSTTPDDNIDTSAGAINYQELFPAVKLSAILDVIQAAFGITFQGGFLQTERFKKAYMYFKNTVAYNYVTPPIDIVFTQVVSQGVVVAPPWPYTFSFTDATNGAEITIDDDNSIELSYVQYQYEFPPGSTPTTSDTGVHSVVGLFTGLTSNAIIYVDVYRQGQFQNTIEVNDAFQGGVSENLWVEDNTNNPGINSKVNFKFRSSAPITADIELRYFFNTPLGVLDGIKSINCNSITTANEVDLTTNAPNLKVTDFISNFLKLFNLTAYGISEDVYELQTIEEWYNEGGFVDVTEHVDLKSIELARIKLFKNIAYEYKESKSLTNREFANLFLREYGNLTEAFNYDGGDYNVKVIFENLLFSKFDNIDLQVAYCIDEGLKGYVPGPCILYEYGEKAVNFYMTDGNATTDLLTSYVAFGQDLEVIGTNYSLNWGTETSSLLLTAIENGLYNTYYKAYLENLYNPKNRETKIKAVLPLDIVTTLKLNDRLTIRTRRFIINSLKINLTNGETTMVLVNDFRYMIADGIPPIYPPIKPGPDAGCFDVYIPFVKNATQCVITTTATGVTITPSTITSPQNVEVCIPANPSPETYIVSETTAHRLTTESLDQLITDEGEGDEFIVLELTWTLTNGDQVANQIFIQQG